MINSSLLPDSAGQIFGRHLLLAIALGVALSLLLAGPASADKGERHERGRHFDKDSQRDWQNRREWHDDRGGYRYQPQYRRPYYYAQPVYVPPPVYYEPRQSPGISLFFPLDLRR